MRRLLALTIAVAALSGCGNARTRPPDIDHPIDPVGKREYTIDNAGVSFTGPANWQEVVPTGTLVGGLRSKTATLAIWRYPRTEPLPADRAELDAARQRLVDRVRAADPSFVLRSERVGRRAITLLGTQTIAGVQVGVRSRHVFKHGAEVVVDAYAPPEDFDRVDRSVFQPLLKTLEVRAP